MTTYRDRHLAGLYSSEEERAEQTVEQLKQQLKDQGKPTSGTKDELLARLAEPADIE